MDEFPYAYFCIEHIFVCPTVVSVFVGSIIVFKHGKSLKIALGMSPNDPYPTFTWNKLQFCPIIEILPGFLLSH